ncbi:MAG: hypothetical protein JXR80_05250, partial [Deltaproteobacteria bacterium]|nr:hypothetical protein [Deltaproteobacteria bacterium]
MKKLRWRWQKPLIVFVLVVFYGCVAAQETRKGATPQVVEVGTAQAAKGAVAGAAGGVEAAAVTGAAVYQQQVAPMTTLACAQCHEPVFNNIRDNGGKHQIDCRECHEE